MRDWKVVTLDPKTLAPLHEEWSEVRLRPDGWVEVELHEEEDIIVEAKPRLICTKRRYYPAKSIIYIEEMGLKRSAKA